MEKILIVNSCYWLVKQMCKEVKRMTDKKQKKGKTTDVIGVVKQARLFAQNAISNYYCPNLFITLEGNNTTYCVQGAPIRVDAGEKVRIFTDNTRFLDPVTEKEISDIVNASGIAILGKTGEYKFECHIRWGYKMNKDDDGSGLPYGT
jgi:hypothetical protein